MINAAKIKPLFLMLYEKNYYVPCRCLYLACKKEEQSNLSTVTGFENFDFSIQNTD